jgi:hypothetical protein
MSKVQFIRTAVAVRIAVDSERIALLTTVFKHVVSQRYGVTGRLTRLRVASAWQAFDRKTNCVTTL